MDRATEFQQLQERLYPDFSSAIAPQAAPYTCLITCENGDLIKLYLMASGQLRFEWDGPEGNERVYCNEDALLNHLVARLAIPV